MRCESVMLDGPRGAVRVVAGETPEPGPGEVLVKMEACGVCHSDLFVAGLERLPIVPLTLGHEGIGRVVARGEGTTGVTEGERVGVTFLAATCGECELCRTGRARYCGRQVNAGYTAHGAMTSAGVARAQHLARIPEELSAAEAAPLCCAGWTAYGALREAGLQPGQWAGIFGMGGLGHLAVQYAKTMGLKVAVADVSEAKLDHARTLGANAAVIADQAGRTMQKQLGGMDAAIVLTGNPAAIQQAFKSVKRNGTVVLVGLSSSTYELPLVDTVLKGIQIRGSYLGTTDDLDAVLRLAADGTVRPHVETFAVSEAPALLERLKRGEQTGRAVIVFW